MPVSAVWDLGSQTRPLSIVHPRREQSGATCVSFLFLFPRPTITRRRCTCTDLRAVRILRCRAPPCLTGFRNSAGKRSVAGDDDMRLLLSVACLPSSAAGTGHRRSNARGAGGGFQTAKGKRADMVSRLSLRLRLPNKIWQLHIFGRAMAAGRKDFDPLTMLNSLCLFILWKDDKLWSTLTSAGGVSHGNLAAERSPTIPELRETWCSAAAVGQRKGRHYPIAACRILCSLRDSYVRMATRYTLLNKFLLPGTLGAEWFSQCSPWR